MDYRRLKHGEIIQAGDEVDSAADGWRDDPVWVPTNCVGKRAPDPKYPAHRAYRRPLVEMQESFGRKMREYGDPVLTIGPSEWLTRGGDERWESD